MENLSTDTGDLPPTAAVGSTAPAGTNNQPDPTFTMEQVMSLMASITKQAASSAASSAVNAALTACPAPARDRGNFYLPPFDPDVRSHDVRDWCANIDDTIATFGIPPQEARMKAILQLKGRAKIWADTWSLQSTSWNQMKQDLISTFSNEFRYADDVQKWRSYTSDHATSYAEYATTGWTLFKRVHPEATDTQVVDALITGIYSEHVRSELLRNTPESLPQLVSVLKTYRKRKFDAIPDKTNTQSKRPRSDISPNPTPQYICFKCNKPGHSVRDCKGAIESVFKPKPNVPESTSQSVECKYCHRKGHVENNCFRKQREERT